MVFRFPPPRKTTFSNIRAFEYAFISSMSFLCNLSEIVFHQRKDDVELKLIKHVSIYFDSHQFQIPPAIGPLNVYFKKFFFFII